MLIELLSSFSDLDWEDKNVQPSRAKEGKPLCPNYGLIGLCAELTGIEPEKFDKQKQFCGLRKNLTLGKQTGWPKVACWEIQKDLSMKLAIAQKPADKIEPESSIRRELNSNKSLAEISKSLEKYNQEKSKVEERENILNRFREVIFNNCYVHTGDDAERNPHIKTVSKADDLSTYKVLGQVQTFVSALSEITGRVYDPNPKEIFLNEVAQPAHNCKQCPHMVDYESWQNRGSLTQF